MIVTALVKEGENKHEITFSISNDAKEKEVLDKAFELAMYKYIDFDSVEIRSMESE